MREYRARIAAGAPPSLAGFGRRPARPAGTCSLPARGPRGRPLAGLHIPAAPPRIAAPRRDWAPWVGALKDDWLSGGLSRGLPVLGGAIFPQPRVRGTAGGRWRPRRGGLRGRPGRGRAGAAPSLHARGREEEPPAPRGGGRPSPRRERRSRSGAARSAAPAREGGGGCRGHRPALPPHAARAAGSALAAAALVVVCVGGLAAAGSPPWGGRAEAAEEEDAAAAAGEQRPGGPMEEREGEVRWDGLCSRDAAARAAALDTIGQAVLRRAESVASGAAADGLPVPAARDGLGEALARLLMLSKRCPFPDVREKSEAILGGVQVSAARHPFGFGTGPRALPAPSHAGRPRVSSVPTPSDLFLQLIRAKCSPPLRLSPRINTWRSVSETQRGEEGGISR